jgi:hypothetical protein
MERELFTASRSSCLLACQRKHYWRYEIGLKPVSECAAFRFGHAWHTAMENRWKGMDFEANLAASVEGVEFTEFDAATLSGLLAGYYACHKDEPVKELFPEVEFRYALPGSRTFDAAGKIDGLGMLTDGRLALVEHKTTSDEVGPDSDYWLRLRFNGQIYQYVSAARTLGWDVALVLYDVTRKPMIRPLANVPTLDEAGFKIVLGPDGQRVFKKDGSPYQTANKEKGEVIQGAPETADQYGERLAQDTLARPEFYFARREVPVLDQDMAEFETQRSEMARQILYLRAASRKAMKPEHAWARNCGHDCRFCEFAGFCMQNISVDPMNPPAGFVVGEKNPELSK